jgi:membrane protease YdiL (CAAX protease family)
MLFLAAIWPYKLAAPERMSLTTFQLQFSFAVIGPGLAAFVEEVVFRGVLQPRLERSLGVAAGILACSLLFTLAHAGNTEFSVQAYSYFIASIYFGIIAWRTDSLFISVIGHVALNVAGNAVVFIVGPVNSGNWSTTIAWFAGIATMVAFSGFIWLLRRDLALGEA